MGWITEQWLPVLGFEGRYEVSNLGRVRSIWQQTERLRGQILRQHGRGAKRRLYPSVTLYREGKRHPLFVHILVMLAFSGLPPVGHEVDHLDNNPQNSRLENLEYVTRSEQHKRSYRRDKRVHPNKGGELSPAAKLTWIQVYDIRRRLAAKELSGRALARELGVCHETISAIHTGKIWRVKSSDS